jgi:hypothetical protein
MSSYDYYSTTESETDEEYEQQMEEMEQEMIRDRDGEFLCELMHKNNIRSPLNGPMDGDMLNDCLHPHLKMEDVVYKNFLRYDGQVALHDRIARERIDEFREVAKVMAEHYSPFCASFSSYVNGVTAHLIKYHYRL